MRFRRLRLIALWFFVIAVCWGLYRAYALPPLGPMGEQEEPDEGVLTSRILADGLSIVNATRTNGIYHRDGHPKGQGCALATLTVNSLDVPYNQGLFAKPAQFKAWIRFSSGNPTIQSDWYPDARGMAIKVLGVSGKKLLPGEENDRTQDFVMMNNPAFFIASVDEYAQLTRLQNLGYQLGKSLYQFRYFFEDSTGSLWNPFAWRLRELRIAAGILKWPPRNLLAIRFFSISAYTLGAQNYVKYMARPVNCGASERVPWSTILSLSADAVHNNLANQLNGGRNYCFDLMIQPQVIQKNMPVENPTIEWKESDSPYIPVARIEIGKQDIDVAQNNGFCENLSFTPWHALPEHRPVGGLNRIREAVYQGISQYRRCMNGTPVGEPKDDGSQAFDAPACKANEPIPGSTLSTSAKAVPKQ